MEEYKQNQENTAEISPWITHVDSNGKTVYVNILSGNTSFVKPEFLSDFRVEFKSASSHASKSLRHISGTSKASCKNMGSRITKSMSESPTTIDTSCLINWINPVLHASSHGTVCVDVTAKNSTKILRQIRLTREMILQAEVLGQVDKKFIACLVKESSDVMKGCEDDKENSFSSDEQMAACKNGGSILLLIDQHATHERIRLERLQKNLYLPITRGGSGLMKKAVLSERLTPPLLVSVNGWEMSIIKSCRSQLCDAGLILSLNENESTDLSSACFPKLRQENQGYNPSSYLVECKHDPDKYRNDPTAYIDDQTKFRNDSATYRDDKTKNRNDPTTYRDNPPKYRNNHSIWHSDSGSAAVHPNSFTVTIHSAPACLVSKDKSDLIIEFFKEVLQSLSESSGSSQTSLTSTTPELLHKALCSHACHGAIKFGDRLTKFECERMIKSLGQCELPFQCAHGRPSVAPILQLQTSGKARVSASARPPNLSRLKPLEIQCKKIKRESNHSSIQI